MFFASEKCNVVVVRLDSARGDAHDGTLQKGGDDLGRYVTDPVKLTEGLAEVAEDGVNFGFRHKGRAAQPWISTRSGPRGLFLY